MFKTESLFPALEITNPSFVEILYSNMDSILLESVHQMLIGRSPLVIVQVALTPSSKFTSSSPKENGII